MLVDVGDTRLHVEERGGGDLGLIVLHGGPGIDHTMFGDWLAPLGHSFGALIALQHAVDFSGRPAGTVISSGAPSERLLMSHVERELERFEPVELREQVQASWAREAE